MLNILCGPSILYIGFSLIQIFIDIYKEYYDIASVKIVIMIVFALILNVLCKMNFEIIAWIIVLIPIIMMSIISILLLKIFGIDPDIDTIKNNSTILDNYDKYYDKYNDKYYDKYYDTGLYDTDLYYKDLYNMDYYVPNLYNIDLQHRYTRHGDLYYKDLYYKDLYNTYLYNYEYDSDYDTKRIDRDIIRHNTYDKIYNTYDLCYNIYDKYDLSKNRYNYYVIDEVLNNYGNTYFLNNLYNHVNFSYD